MKRRLMAVGHPDEVYLRGLSRYAALYLTGFPFELHCFTEKAEMAAFLEKRPVSYLVLCDRWIGEEGKLAGTSLSCPSRCRVLAGLADGSPISRQKGVTCVSRYQSVPSLFQRLMEIYREQSDEEGPVLKNEISLTGFYSPSGESLTGVLALTYGLMRAEKEKTLFLSLRTFSGLSRLMGTSSGRDLSDLLDFAEEGGRDLEVALSSLVRPVGALSFLPPAANDRDISETGPEVWLSLMDRIRERTAYERIICDLGSGLNGLFPLLGLCDEIFMPVRKKGLGRAASEEFLSALEAEERQDIRRKIKNVDISGLSELLPEGRFPEGLPLGPYGDRLRAVMTEIKTGRAGKWDDWQDQ